MSPNKNRLRLTKVKVLIMHNGLLEIVHIVLELVMYLSVLYFIAAKCVAHFNS